MTQIMRVRVTMNGWQGAPGLLTYYFRPNQVTLPGDATNATTRVRAALAVLAPVFPIATTLQVSGVCDVLEDTTGALLTSAGVAAPAVVPGTAAGSIGPPQVMAGLAMDTGAVVDGRKLRARSFLGPLASSFTATGLPSASLLTTVNAYAVALLTVAPPAAATPIVAWHRPRKATALLPFRAGTSSPVTTAAAVTRFFTLRSRLL